MTCPSCGYPRADRIGDWCPVCVDDVGLREDGSRPWALLAKPAPFEQREIERHDYQGIRAGDRVRTHGVDGREWIVDLIVDAPSEHSVCRRGPRYRVLSRERRLLAWFCRDEITRLDWLDD